MLEVKFWEALAGLELKVNLVRGPKILGLFQLYSGLFIIYNLLTAAGLETVLNAI